MSIKSFYPSLYFERKQSKTLLIVCTVLWAFLLPAGIYILHKAPFFMVIWTFLGIHQIVGLVYSLQNGLYVTKSNKAHQKMNVSPEEFIEGVKKELDKKGD